MQLAKRSTYTCHFERNVSEAEKSENAQFIPCHFERSVSVVEKSENVSIC